MFEETFSRCAACWCTRHILARWASKCRLESKYLSNRFWKLF